MHLHVILRQAANEESSRALSPQPVQNGWSSKGREPAEKSFLLQCELTFIYCQPLSAIVTIVSPVKSFPRKTNISGALPPLFVSLRKTFALGDNPMAAKPHKSLPVSMLK